jgi:hypothetical protein
MSRMKVVLLSLVTMLAVSGLASSSALAKTENKYFEAGGTAISAETAITGTVGIADLASELAGAKILIECTENTFKGTVGKEGTSKGSIKYGGCKLFEINKGKKESETTCTVSIPEFKFVDQLIEGTKGGVVEDEFKPETPPVFVEITIGVCTLKGTFKTEGTYTAQTSQEGEVAKKEGELRFDSTGSNVTFNKSKAAYFDTLKKLELGGKEWYVD